ncbi:MAG: aminotransferase class III-fold pyridoxal phosphate-dependent enzyme [Acidimicrobiia bacterium]|nr:aminotransferase class III-fold pyridoxal phosphate-dependent enzyme [Acidimicrobiia bacterium]
MNDFLSRSEVIAPVLAFDTDIVATHAQGLWVHDAAGRKWADFACGTAVTNLGHNHPAVIAAAREQLDRLAHAGCVFRYESMVALGEQLRRITPAGIEMFAFANSGAEAVEGAVKLAKHTTKRPGVVAFRGAFHGRTMGALSYTTSNAKYRNGYHPMLGSVFVAPYPHSYRWGMTEEDAIDLSLSELARMFHHEVIPENIAALLVEPVQGEGGYYPAPPRFLEALRAIADAHGILLIFDEVQTGFGRTAEWFGVDHFTVDPDIIAIGKGIANGLPLSAYGAATDVLAAWPEGAHGTTFGGNPVACAAAVAVIDAMEPLLAQAKNVSAHALERLTKATQDHPTIGDVRGLGLMIGVELVRDRDNRDPDAEAMKAVMKHGLENELIVIPCGPDGNIIRFIPPLIATIDDVDRAVDIIQAGLRRYES